MDRTQALHGHSWFSRTCKGPAKSHRGVFQKQRFVEGTQVTVEQGEPHEKRMGGGGQGGLRKLFQRSWVNLKRLTCRPQTLETRMEENVL